MESGGAGKTAIAGARLPLPATIFSDAAGFIRRQSKEKEETT